MDQIKLFITYFKNYSDSGFVEIAYQNYKKWYETYKQIPQIFKCKVEGYTKELTQSEYKNQLLNEFKIWYSLLPSRAIDAEMLTKYWLCDFDLIFESMELKKTWNFDSQLEVLHYKNLFENLTAKYRQK